MLHGVPPIGQALELRRHRQDEDVKVRDLQESLQRVQRTEAADGRAVKAMSNALAAQRQVRLRNQRPAIWAQTPAIDADRTIPSCDSCLDQVRDQLRQEELDLFSELKKLSEVEYPELRWKLRSVLADTSAPPVDDTDTPVDAPPGTPAPSADLVATLRGLRYRSPQVLNQHGTVFAATNAAGDACVVKVIDLEGPGRLEREASLQATVAYLQR